MAGEMCQVGCGRVPDPGMFMCNFCWGLLTVQQRRRVYDAFTQARDGIRGAAEHYEAIKAEAIALVKAELGVSST